MTRPRTSRIMPTRPHALASGAALALAALVGCSATDNGGAKVQADPAPPTSVASAAPRQPRQLTPGDMRFLDDPREAARINQPTAATSASDAAPPVVDPDQLDANESWGIMLETFDGQGSTVRARQRLANLSRAMNRDDLRLIRRAGGAAIVLGSYEAYDDAKAQADLDYIQSIATDAGPLFDRAHLIPPDHQFDGDTSERNLLMAKRIYGNAARYTIEIGVYDAPIEALRRKYAEEAVQTLRDEGEAAFYFHGNRVSSVTIGAFSDLDYNPDTGFRSARVREVMGRHPHHLINGFEQTVKGSTVKLPSRMMQIPDPPR